MNIREGPLHVGSATAAPVKSKGAIKSEQTDSLKTLQSAPRNNRGVRMAFELDDVLRMYSPEQFKSCQAYDVGGVNILNKKSLDSRAALDKMKRRRETHNRVERHRRVCINLLILELISLLPKEQGGARVMRHRANVLRATVAHIRTLTQENEALKRRVETSRLDHLIQPPTVLVTEHRDLQDGPLSPLTTPIPTMISSFQAARSRLPCSPGATSEPRTEPSSSSPALASPSGISIILEPSNIVAETPNANCHEHYHVKSRDRSDADCVQHPSLFYCQDSCTSTHWSSHRGSPSDPPSGSILGFAGCGSRFPGLLNYGPSSPYLPTGTDSVHPDI
ncbi:MAG: hypothetical protein J3Q66DRAFT_405877 [Benniella sp.]|nr:MAG: hypothetical protein J3Q66DRAFT_405877 [Benniella sp.]